MADSGQPWARVFAADSSGLIGLWRARPGRTVEDRQTTDGVGAGGGQ